MKQYLDLLSDVLENGTRKGDRTGTGTTSVFGRQTRFNLQEGFPLVTTKKVPFKSVVTELLWFLKGDTNTKYLKEHKCKIWDEWALTFDDVNNAPPENFVKFDLEEGDLGPVYGKQWRSWQCADKTVIDQISEVIELIKTKPDSRRLVVSAWNPADLPNEKIKPQANVINGKMALAPCHLLFQFYTTELTFDERLAYVKKHHFSGDKTLAFENKFVNAWDDLEKTEVMEDFINEMNNVKIPKRKIDCQLYQRSADIALGVPFNIASYALLLEMVAHVCNMIPNDFVHTFGDLHVYNGHEENILTQLSREPLRLPTLKLNKEITNIFDFIHDDIVLEDYVFHPPLAFKIAI